MMTSTANLEIHHVSESINDGPQFDGRLLPCFNASNVATLVELRAEFKRLDSQWQQAPCRGQILDIIERATSSGALKVSNAVSIGIGSFTEPGDNC